MEFHQIYPFCFIAFENCLGISAVYNTKEVERIGSAFDRSNEKLFPSVERLQGDVLSKRFNTILPPPNVTGKLHLGHALMITVLDVICRWKQLKGYSVELIPGLDHAGIATQVVVEQQLKKESGQTRFDVGKDKFIELVSKWKDEKGLHCFQSSFKHLCVNQMPNRL